MIKKSHKNMPNQNIPGINDLQPLKPQDIVIFTQRTKAAPHL